MQFKVLVFNAQDLFLALAHEPRPEDLGRLSDEEWQYFGQGPEKIKPLSKLHGIARMFAEEDPDLACLCEVGGVLALENLNRLFLGQRYHVFLQAGNSDRGIENGFLLKKGGAFDGELHSFKEWPVVFHYPHEIDAQTHAIAAAAAPYLDLGVPHQRRLSRDIPALYLRHDSTLRMVVLLAHLKSGLDPHGLDPGGGVRRKAELEALVAIYRKLSDELKVPVLVGGDFNGKADRDGFTQEFEALYRETDLDDALRVAGRDAHERLTHFTFVKDKILTQQFDYLFLPRALQGRIVAEKTYVYRYRFGTAEGEIMLPFSFRDRNSLPSDHYPLVCVLDLS